MEELQSSVALWLSGHFRMMCVEMLLLCISSMWSFESLNIPDLGSFDRSTIIDNLLEIANSIIIINNDQL